MTNDTEMTKKFSVNFLVTQLKNLIFVKSPKSIFENNTEDPIMASIEQNSKHPKIQTIKSRTNDINLTF